MKDEPTEKVTYKFGNFYRNLCPSGPENLKVMLDDVMTVHGHVSLSENNIRHYKHPEGSDSCCKYEVNRPFATKFTNQEKISIPTSQMLVLRNAKRK